MNIKIIPYNNTIHCKIINMINNNLYNTTILLNLFQVINCFDETKHKYCKIIYIFKHQISKFYKFKTTNTYKFIFILLIS